MISLEFAKERRQAISQQFANIGMSFEYWPAVDGKEIPDEVFEGLDYSARDRNMLPPAGRGAVGCTLSHFAVFRHMIENRIQMAAIFEDDAMLHRDLQPVLRLLEGKEDKFDIVKLQRQWQKPRFVPLYELYPPYRLGRLKYSDVGTYGYVITLRAAKHLLMQFPRPTYEIDWLISRFWENGLGMVYYLDPPVVVHDESMLSHIDGERSKVLQQYRSVQRGSLSATLRRWHHRVWNSVVRRRTFMKLRRLDRELDPHEFQ